MSQWVPPHRRFASILCGFFVANRIYTHDGETLGFSDSIVDWMPCLTNATHDEPVDVANAAPLNVANAALAYCRSLPRFEEGRAWSECAGLLWREHMAKFEDELLLGAPDDDCPRYAPDRLWNYYDPTARGLLMLEVWSELPAASDRGCGVAEWYWLAHTEANVVRSPLVPEAVAELGAIDWRFDLIHWRGVPPPPPEEEEGGEHSEWHSGLRNLSSFLAINGTLTLQMAGEKHSPYFDKLQAAVNAFVADDAKATAAGGARLVALEPRAAKDVVQVRLAVAEEGARGGVGLLLEVLVAP